LLSHAQFPDNKFCYPGTGKTNWISGLSAWQAIGDLPGGKDSAIVGDTVE
jgi:hypothetical protein